MRRRSSREGLRTTGMGVAYGERGEGAKCRLAHTERRDQAPTRIDVPHRATRRPNKLRWARTDGWHFGPRSRVVHPVAAWAARQDHGAGRRKELELGARGFWSSLTRLGKIRGSRCIPGAGRGELAGCGPVRTSPRLFPSLVRCYADGPVPDTANRRPVRQSRRSRRGRTASMATSPRAQVTAEIAWSLPASASRPA